MPQSQGVSTIPGECDICSRSFWVEPESIVGAFYLKDEEIPAAPPSDEPDFYAFVCPDCAAAGLVYEWP